MEWIRQTEHRPYAMPRSPWVMRMRWEALLFAHWRIDAAALRGHVPERLTIEEYDGSAWIAVVPFRMNRTRLRCGPPVPTTYRFAELNVRTYVTDGERPGVWFFSLDAASAMAVRLARWAFQLNYVRATMSCVERDGWIEYCSRRRDGAARFEGRYRPIGESFEAAPGTLEHFLTERYCMYSGWRNERLLRGEIHHAPWPLHRAEAELEVNTMIAGDGIEQPDGEAHLMFVRGIDVVGWGAGGV